ncbi:MAG: hypothetical protein IKW74_00120, partial [Thermoguttaceae bacterium]|nr:hypothetical protein [Thermoguttaceae bacterium]
VKIAQKMNINMFVKFDMGLLIDRKLNQEDPYPYHGVIHVTNSDNTIDLDTGTITVRGEIANQGNVLYPGYICSIRIPDVQRSNVMIVLEKAVCTDLNTKYLWVLNSEGKPEKRIVELGELINNRVRIITSGVQEGETYIVDGVQNVRANGAIQELEPNPEDVISDSELISNLEEEPAAEEKKTEETNAVSDDPAKNADTANNPTEVSNTATDAEPTEESDWDLTPDPAANTAAPIPAATVPAQTVTPAE